MNEFDKYLDTLSSKREAQERRYTEAMPILEKFFETVTEWLTPRVNSKDIHIDRPQCKVVPWSTKDLKGMTITILKDDEQPYAELVPHVDDDDEICVVCGDFILFYNEGEKRWQERGQYNKLNVDAFKDGLMNSDWKVSDTTSV